MKNTPKRLAVWAVIVGAILMLPLVMRMPWTMGDFIFAGVVLFGAATGYEMVTRKMKNGQHRLVVGAVVMMVLILIWGWAVGGP